MTDRAAASTLYATVRAQAKESIDRLLAAQHGVVARYQVLESGATPSLIDHRLDVGEWVSVAPGIYTARSSSPTWERDLTAALLSRPGSLACRRSAAILHDLEGFRARRPEIVIPYGGNARLRLAVVRRSLYFHQLGRTTIRGFPVTDLAETLFMIAGVVDSGRLERLVDDAIAQGHSSIDDLNEVHLRHLGDRIPGIRRFEAALATRQTGAEVPPESELERHLHRLLDQMDLPQVEYQHRLPWSSRGQQRVDAFLPSWGLIIEADGRTWHTRVAGFETDRERDNAATAAGYAVLRFTWTMLTKKPDRCRQTILRAGRMRTSLSNQPGYTPLVAQRMSDTAATSDSTTGTPAASSSDRWWDPPS